MKKIIIFIIAITALFPLFYPRAVYCADKISGTILLQVEANGEAWYVYPKNGERYYLGRPVDAFEIMKKLSLGAKHDYIMETEIFPERLSGLILLDVEKNGEAYYIYPDNRKKYFLSRPADAFHVMRELGLGITNKDLVEIPLGNIDIKTDNLPKQNTIIFDVPFATQAPFGEWNDKRQQDGCEEVSALMAVKWAKKEKLNEEEARTIIIDASEFELEKYGEFRDISSADTVKWIFNDYFNFYDVALKKDINIDDIINELKQGNIIVTPHNGRLLHNPNYTPPGPIRHMLVIRGYDALTNEFITNDSGTRQGEAYRYNTDVLFTAIRDYPTGYHKDITKIEKNMIVVSK